MGKRAFTNQNEKYGAKKAPATRDDAQKIISSSDQFGLAGVWVTGVCGVDSEGAAAGAEGVGVIVETIVATFCTIETAWLAAAWPAEAFALDCACTDSADVLVAVATDATISVAAEGTTAVTAAVTAPDWEGAAAETEAATCAA